MGPLGVEWVSSDYWVIDTAYYAEPNTSQLDLKFFYYLVKYIGLNHLKDGTSNPSLSRDTFGSQQLPTPPVAEQRAIAEVFTVFDDKIEQNRRTGETLERSAQAIFRAWFVDFEPVRAKADGATAFPSMPRDVFGRLPTTFEPSPLGPVPAGWRLGAVGETVIQARRQVVPQATPLEWFDHFSLPAFDQGRRPSVDQGKTILSNKLLVESNCVLFSKLNPRFPRVWLPPVMSERRQIASTEFLVIVPRGGWTRNYLYALMQQPSVLDELVQAATGTSGSHQRITPSDLLNMPIPIPDEPLRVAYEQVASPMLDLAASLHAESDKLAEMRDYLLPKLLSGQVRVRDVEASL